MAVLQATRVLPIVGLDVGAIGSKSLVIFGSGWTFAIWLFVFIFIKSFSIELRLPGGGFSTAPPSAILVRYGQPVLKIPNCAVDRGKNYYCIG